MCGSVIGSLLAGYSAEFLLEGLCGKAFGGFGIASVGRISRVYFDSEFSSAVAKATICLGYADGGRVNQAD